MYTKKSYITLKHLVIDGSKYIGLKHYPSKAITVIIESLSTIDWSDDYGMHYLPNTKSNLDQVFSLFKGIAHINCTHFYRNKSPHISTTILNVDGFRKRRLKPGYRACPEEFLRKLELKRYALSTAKTYISFFEKFINFYPEIALESLDENDIRNYLQHLIQENKSGSYLNQVVNSIKFYYEVVKDMPNRFYSIERPRQEYKLPKVISMEEIAGMINVTRNIKHRCIIALLYSAGLRRGELLNLKLTDIDSKRMLITVRSGKGNKDRVTLLSPTMLEELRNYFIEYRPKDYLFEGESGLKYGSSSVLLIVKRAGINAKVTKNVTPHMLRHSFATHLLENGADLRYIQSLLGHNSSKTTEIYTQVTLSHVKEIKSPLDSLNLTSYNE